MIIKHPSPAEIPQLRQLWQQAFGDTDDYLDSFFALGFAPDRCRCGILDGKVVCALYWFACGDNLAYLYAVVTEKSMQGRGLFHQLMEDTHAHLRQQGYTGVVLVPGSKNLFALYQRLGYVCFGGICERLVLAEGPAAALESVSAERYAQLRQQYLPAGGVVQEGPLLDFLASQLDFYAGSDFLLCGAVTDGNLFAPEYLGDPANMPGILQALQAKTGTFRSPGKKTFAMYYALADPKTPPAYFAFALD